MSDKRPLLSIIIPVFNNELYIKQTLTSVFEQIDNDVEVIIVNDGSTDNSAALIQKAIDEYQGTGDLHFISQQNAGVSVARNVALDKAQGRWIGFIDGDDLWCPHFLQTIKPLPLEDEGDLIDFQYHYFAQHPPTSSVPTLVKRTDITQVNHDALYEIFRRSHWHIWSRIYRHELINQRRFHVGRRYEDMMFTPWLYLEAHHIISLDQVLYWYRDNAQGITRNIQPSDANDMVFALNQIIDNARTQPPSQMPSRIITPLIINCFNEIKGIHAKLYGFYNYSEHTISTLKAAAGLLPSGSLSLKRRLHLRYPGLWKRVSQLRHILRRGR